MHMDDTIFGRASSLLRLRMTHCSDEVVACKRDKGQGTIEQLRTSHTRNVSVRFDGSRFSSRSYLFDYKPQGTKR